METVWAGTVVEEANLTDNISTLRQALGDDAREPIYGHFAGGRYGLDARRMAAIALGAMAAVSPLSAHAQQQAPAVAPAASAASAGAAGVRPRAGRGRNAAGERRRDGWDCRCCRY